MRGGTLCSKSGLVGGVDGVRGGWVMAATAVAPESSLDILVFQSFSDLWSHAKRRDLLAVTVDIPTGLPGREGRAADREARGKLKPSEKGKRGRTSSVFPAPPLSSLGATTYKKAGELARRSTDKGLTRQAFGLFPKIKEVRSALQPDDFECGAVPRAAEVHPEVSFRFMAGSPMSFHKSLQAGVAERLSLLECHFPDIVDAAVRTSRTGPPHPGLDDVLDAVAAAWTARRLVQEEAARLGGCERDAAGYPMNIWA
ncbi:MAG: DUF429 domain-containing protein [bacterium]|nr:DUF429 domain-containing protein [bacterium]MDE0500810.1 DUF429 domain-containing protein [bacterium]